MKQRFITAISLMLVAFFCSPLSAGSVNGIVKSYQLYQVGVPINGVIKSVAAKPGLRVSKGDELLKVDCSRYDTLKRQAKASAKSVSINALNAKLDLQRATEMYDQDLIADIEMAEAKDRYEESNAASQAALASVKLASLNQSYCTLRSPADGVVLRVNTNVGATVSGESDSNALVGIKVNSHPTVRISLPETESLQIGQEVIISSGQSRFTGFVARVQKSALQQTAQIVTEDATSLMAGQAVQVDS